MNCKALKQVFLDTYKDTNAKPYLIFVLTDETYSPW